MYVVTSRSSSKLQQGKLHNKLLSKRMKCHFISLTWLRTIAVLWYNNVSNFIEIVQNVIAFRWPVSSYYKTYCHVMNYNSLYMSCFTMTLLMNWRKGLSFISTDIRVLIFTNLGHTRHSILQIEEQQIFFVRTKILSCK